MPEACRRGGPTPAAPDPTRTSGSTPCWVPSGRARESSRPPRARVPTTPPPPPAESTDRILLLGAEEARYGEYRFETVGSGRLVCALSVGSDRASPALRHKGQADVPNEDALLALESRTHVLMAVADAHFGASASHEVLRRLDASLAEIPRSPAALLRVLDESVATGESIQDESATTLVVAVLRRDLRAGFGFSFGDSSCVLVGADAGARRLNRPTASYVRPADPRTVAAERACYFDIDARPGELLLVFTDGIDGCHYGHPETSLGPRHLEEALHQTGASARAYARRLTEWALAGCGGNPGGQDNLALVVAET